MDEKKKVHEKSGTVEAEKLITFFFRSAKYSSSFRQSIRVSSPNTLNSFNHSLYLTRPRRSPPFHFLFPFPRTTNELWFYYELVFTLNG